MEQTHAWALTDKNMRRRAIAVFGVYCMLSPAWSQPSKDAVSLATMRDELQSGRAVVIDIREPEEHAGGVAPGVHLLPMSQLRKRLNEIPTDPSRPVLLVCRTQNRSSATLRALRELGGYGHVRYVQGGMSEWASRGWPLEKPKAAKP